MKREGGGREKGMKKRDMEGPCMLPPSVAPNHVSIVSALQYNSDC